MWKKIALASMALWIVSASYIGYRIAFGNAKQVDNRIEISLRPAERELVLGEMRILLKGLKGILKGLSKDDMDFVVKSATSNGMVMAQDVNPALMSKLPMSFKKVGIAVHKSFDQLAKEANGLTNKEVLKKVDVILNSCVSCHETYKVTEDR